jgi:hypothetical protein
VLGRGGRSGDLASLSRVLCKCRSWLVDPAGETVGVEQFELVEGCSPSLDDGAFDEASEGGALVGGLAAVAFSGSGSLVFDVADGEPEQLDHSVVVGEVSAVLDDLAELVAVTRSSW